MDTSTATHAHPSVVVLERHTLQCANENHCSDLSKVQLGPLDQLVAPFIPVAVVFVYEQSGSTETIPVQHLQRALELLLDYYPLLTGRLHIAIDGTYEVASLGAGAELLVAQCNEHLDSFSSTQGRISLMDLPSGSNALFGPFDASLEGSCRDSLFTVQHTRFACGSVALGVRLRHINCDGHGFFQFMRDLAELYRGLNSAGIPTLSHPPHFQPYMSDLEMTLDEKQAALAFRPSLLVVEPRVLPSEAMTVPASEPQTPVVGRILRFSDFLTPVDFRGNRFPDLPTLYFPNALLCLYTSLSQDVLAHAPLWQIAKHLHDLMRNEVPDAQHLKSTLRWITAQPDKRRIRSGFRYGNGSIMVSQWAKFEMYEGTDFEDGQKPILVSTPFTSISLVDGLAYTLPTEMQGKTGGDKRAIDVNLALSSPIWEILEHDKQLKRFSSSWAGDSAQT
ncbi:transferase family-domain-containing protein [Lentinula edodes]|uniref:Transferase family-domain-containing protein n=1 Tax=Lentinula lateritia TaxID=40482 RepID=A0A9W9DPS3_9AGAR|nr:transferase family-domain-containing protein [Lentinula edodes]